MPRHKLFTTTGAVILLGFLMLVLSPSSTESCSAPPLDPKILFEGDNPTDIEEDTTHTWKVRMQDVSALSGVIQLFGSTYQTLPENYKTFPGWIGDGPVFGAEYKFAMLYNGLDFSGNSPRYRFIEEGRGKSFEQLNELPGRFPEKHTPAVMSSANLGPNDVLCNSSGDSIEIYKSGYVYDPRNQKGAEWQVTSWATFWSMDVKNLGFNGPEESVESGQITYEGRTGGRDSPVVYAGTGKMEYTFTYLTPSDPDKYVIQVDAAVELKLSSVYQWFEVKRNGPSVNPATGDPYPVRTPVYGPDGTTIIGYENHSSVQWVHGPFYCSVTGVGYKSSSGVGVATPSPAIMTCMVRDNTPPCAMRFENSQQLYGTTGDLLEEWNGTYGTAPNPANPDVIKVQVVDNNPNLAITEMRKTAGVRYKPENFKIGFYYVTQVYNYQPVKGFLCGNQGYSHGTSCDCFPVYRENFVWVKLGDLAADDARVTGAKFNFNGEAMSGKYGEGADTDPAYCILTWEIPIADIKEPLGWHYATTSEQYTDKWGFTHPGWGNGILKYMAYISDGSGYATPDGWDSDAKWIHQETGEQNPGVSGYPDTAARNAADLIVVDATGTRVANDPHPGQPDFNLATGFRDDEHFGNYGFITVYDNDKPSLRLNFTDASLRSPVPQSFTFGNIWYGDFKRASFQQARRTNASVSTTSSKDIVADANLRPYTDDDNSGDLGLQWVFRDGDTETGIKEQGNLMGMRPCKFNPWYYKLFGTAYAGTYNLFTPQNDRQYGFWMTEDVRVRFDFLNYSPEINAMDNINTYRTSGAAPGGVENSTSSVVLRDGSSTQNLRYPEPGSINFRSPNRGDGADIRECSLEATVADQGPTEVGGPFSRNVKIYLYVTGSEMRVFTLQDKEK